MILQRLVWLKNIRNVQFWWPPEALLKLVDVWPQIFVKLVALLYMKVSILYVRNSILSNYSYCFVVYSMCTVQHVIIALHSILKIKDLFVMAYYIFLHTHFNTIYAVCSMLFYIQDEWHNKHTIF